MNPDDVDDMDFPLPIAVDDFSNLHPKKPVITANQDLEKFKNWICVYPIYFDARVPMSQGRKTPLSLAIENPNVLHLLYAVDKLKLKACFEPLKRHPRTFDNFGRIRVNLVLDNGFYADEALSSKMALLRKIGPLLKEAQDKINEVDTGDPEALAQAGQSFLNGNMRY